MDIKDCGEKLIGLALYSVNAAVNGLKDYLEKYIPWIVTFWCLPHCLE